MTYKFAAIALMATALAVAPLAPAHAEGWHHGGGGWHGGHGGGLLWGLVAAGAIVTGAAVAVATAPFNVIADVSAPPPPPRPVYYAAPAPVYYGGYGPAYYQARPVVYSYPQGYGYYGYR